MAQSNIDRNRAIAGDGSASQEAFIGLVCGMIYGAASPIVGHPIGECYCVM
jgi:hypothetical protein